MKKIILILSAVIVLFAIAVFGYYFCGKLFNGGPAEPEKKYITLYYYNPSKDTDSEGNIMCSRNGLVGVERSVSPDITIKQAIDLLIRGELTQNEKKQGITTEFPMPDLELEDAIMDSNGALTLKFNDPSGRTNGGSCRVAILWAQINATARQFPEVKEVKFEPQDGLFQP